jgi:HD domain/GAF domain
VPEHILNKPGHLTPAEFEKMKRHAPIGADILSSIEFPYPVVPVVRHHHENWDGTGYPDGLKGADIPLGARILSVVDCFDALTSDRPYRRRMTEQDALKIIVDRRGTMYDPVVVDTFLASHHRVMPAPDAARHPAARAINDALSIDRDEQRALPAPAADGGVSDGLLAVTSLSRAVSGGARVADVGALMWMVVRQVLPCDAMAVFLPDERADAVSVRYAAGLHAGALRRMTRASGTGVAGWVAVNRRAAINADPALDLGLDAVDLSPALRACLAMPLLDGDTVVAVLTLYRGQRDGFSEDDARLVELLAPRLASSVAEATRVEREGVPAASAAPPLKLVKRG